MRISERTRISELIKANPGVIEALVEFNPHFGKLRNPVLRNLLARRVSISDACRIAGCKPCDFLAKMKSIGFETEGLESAPNAGGTKQYEVPAFIADMKKVELDVRPVLARGEDPLKLILETAKALDKEVCLKIINTFEPTPLISLLAKRGYESWSERISEDLFITWFVKSKLNESGSDLLAGTDILIETTDEFQQMVESFGPGKLHKIDVRDLPMPLPMRQIMEYLPKVKPGEALFVYHKKVPVYLLPELRELGFTYFIQNLADGQINILICKL
jgi:uncharacterized protein (DUF2249 family)